MARALSTCIRPPRRGILTLTPLANHHTHREIGSGTGLVGLCVASAHSGFHPREVVISDQEDHLGLIRRNARTNGLRPIEGGSGEEEHDASGGATTANPPYLGKEPRLRIQEFDWVSGAGVEGLGERPYDVVLGTDVVYCEELWAPVVKVRCVREGVRWDLSRLSLDFDLRACHAVGQFGHLYTHLYTQARTRAHPFNAG